MLCVGIIVVSRFLSLANGLRLIPKSSRVSDQLGRDTFNQFGTDWYSTFKPIDASSPAPGNRLLMRKNACIQGEGFPPTPETEGNEEPTLLNPAFHVRDGQYADTKMKKIPGAVLIATIHHFRTYKADNICHQANSLWPIYDAFDVLEDYHNHVPPVNVTAVLIHQFSGTEGKIWDWTNKIAKLAGHSQGFHTALLSKDDVLEGICADQLVIYDR